MCRFRPILVMFAAAAILSGASGGLAVAADETINLLPHRAVYDLKLASTRGKRALDAVRGRILYDFSGNACEGYALQFRQVSQINSGEGRTMLSDLRAATWEEGSARSYRFKSQNFIDNKLVDDVDGHAERGADSISVSLSKPGDKKVSLEPAIIFPTHHLRQIILAGRAGKTILEMPVFDGSENGERVYRTLAVIGGAIPPDARVPDDAAAKEPLLAKQIRWPVTVSYFDSAKTGGEQTPAYAISFELYESGISRALSLDYNDFVVSGTMTQIEIKDAPPCK